MRPKPVKLTTSNLYVKVYLGSIKKILLLFSFLFQNMNIVKEIICYHFIIICWYFRIYRKFTYSVYRLPIVISMFVLHSLNFQYLHVLNLYTYMWSLFLCVIRLIYMLALLIMCLIYSIKHFHISFIRHPSLKCSMNPKLCRTDSTIAHYTSEVS